MQVFEELLHLFYPFYPAYRSMPGNDDFRIKRNDEIERLEPFLVRADTAHGGAL